MSRPDWCPEETWAKAIEVSEPINPSTILHDLIAENAARALLSAKREGMEEAAEIAYATCAETRHVTLGDKCVAAIRQKAQELRE